MSNIILSRDDFGLKMYNRFPPRYREDDIGQDFALKRYLQACADGGMAYSIDEWNGILDLANPDMARPEALPILFEQFGLPIFNGIPEHYLRYLLPRLSEAWSKKGSFDVIEFIVSSLSGIQTEVVIHYDAQNNVDLDVRLQMDYNIGSYFPSTSQFNRILDYFVPFYVNKTIIYVFIFEDKSKLYPKEWHHDLVHHRFPEYAFIPSRKGLHPFFTAALNIADLGLNDDFILNAESAYDYTIDPDWFQDKLKIVQSESGSIASVWSEYYRYTLNAKERRLTENLVTNEFWRTDEYLDRFHIAPRHDKVAVYMYDFPRHDTLRIDETFRYYSALNTGLVLNMDLITNFSNSDPADLKVDEVFTDHHNTVYCDTPSFVSEKSTEYYRPILNRAYSLNGDFVLNEFARTDEFGDSVTQIMSESGVPQCEGKHVAHMTWNNYGILPSLNTNQVLNNSFVTNYSFHEHGDVDLAETYHRDTTGVTQADSAGFENPNILDVSMGMFTNTDESTLNGDCIMYLPDEYDRITYKDGTVVTVFPSILKMVGAK